MAQIGNVLAPSEDGPRGEDLSVTVEVPRAALGLPEGYRVTVPRKVPHAGELVLRTLSGSESGEEVHLSLPADFPENGALRLRGQGAVREGGSPGDLLVRVHLTDEPLARGGGSSLRLRPLAIVLVVVLAAALAYAALAGP